MLVLLLHLLLQSFYLILLLDHQIAVEVELQPSRAMLDLHIGLAYML